MASAYLALVDPEGNIVKTEKSHGIWTVEDWPAEFSRDAEGKYVLVPNTHGGRSYVLPEGHTVRGMTAKEYKSFVDKSKAGRPVPDYTDIAGRKVVVGSRVAVAFALGRGAEIRIGTVAGFDSIDPEYASIDRSTGISTAEQIVVDWEKDNRKWGGSPAKSKIFAYLQRYVVIQ